MRRHLLALFLALSALLTPLDARAGIPVIDFAAVANLIQQIMYWQQQISAMQKQFDELRAAKEQLQQTYSAITGSRGMDQLLAISDAQRNYLPQSYNDLTSLVSGSLSGYSGLASQVQAIMNANTILTRLQMDALSPEMRQTVEQGRQAAALLSGMTRSAYQNTSQRFSALQQLINAIGRTNDPKAIQELQARIQAEQNMLTNEQTKLQSLYQIAQSEELMRRQRIREQSASDIGAVKSLPAVTY